MYNTYSDKAPAGAYCACHASENCGKATSTVYYRDVHGTCFAVRYYCNAHRNHP